MEFESLVNSVRCKTNEWVDGADIMFESLVNSVRCKTQLRCKADNAGLRALLIL